MHDQLTLIFSCILSQPGPLRTAFGCGALVALSFPWVSLACSIGTYLVFPGLNSMASLAWFYGVSAQSILFVLMHHCLMLPYKCWLILLSALLGATWGAYFFEDLVGLIKALADIFRINFIDVRISSFFQTGCIGLRLCWNALLIIVELHLSLAPSLICVGGGEYIIH